jgi:hypothetical protein
VRDSFSPGGDTIVVLWRMFYPHLPSPLLLAWVSVILLYHSVQAPELRIMNLRIL